jgi:hypothetical protein
MICPTCNQEYTPPEPPKKRKRYRSPKELADRAAFFARKVAERAGELPVTAGSVQKAPKIASTKRTEAARSDSADRFDIQAMQEHHERIKDLSLDQLLKLPASLPKPLPKPRRKVFQFASGTVYESKQLGGAEVDIHNLNGRWFDDLAREVEVIHVPPCPSYRHGIDFKPILNERDGSWITQRIEPEPEQPSLTPTTYQRPKELTAESQLEILRAKYRDCETKIGQYGDSPQVAQVLLDECWQSYDFLKRTGKL